MSGSTSAEANVNTSTISLFYTTLGFSYFCAFISVYVQYPGLLSSNGLLPADTFIDRLKSYQQQKSSANLFASNKGDFFLNIINQYYKTPTIAALYSQIGLPVDVICEVLLIFGILSAFLCSSGYYSNLLYLSMWVSYLSIYLAGMETFLSFQWDILLLEVGFLAIFSSNIFQSRSFHTTILQCYRFLAWKLMFSSGVVKLQAQCPTWESLSALEYHFATQCIPTPLAWFAHQLPPILLRAGVAATLLIEIPLTVLLIIPTVSLRRIGVILQWILQIFIILTGNYTFFNLLTMVLMLPSWIDEHYHVYSSSDEDGMKTRSGGGNSSSSNGSSGSMDNPVVLVSRLMKALNKSIWFFCAEVVLFLCLLVGSAYWMLEGSSFGDSLSEATWWRGSTIAVREDFWKSSLSPVLQVICVSCLYYSIAAVVYSTFLDTSQPIWRGKTVRSPVSDLLYGLQCTAKSLWDVCVGILAVVWLFLSAKPLSSLGTGLDIMRPFIPASLWRLSDQLSLFSINSGYGLFRRMTGVGSTAEAALSAEQRKLGLTVVARPELVLEGLDSASGSWKEIHFRYKPTDVFQCPSFVAPHQPRLDWQMWFAALGSYDHNPWLVHLVLRLLYPRKAGGGDQPDLIEKGKGSYYSPDIFNLLDMDKYPFNHSSPPVAIRIMSYEYDFTRWNASWTAHLPKEAIITTAGPRVPSSSSSSSSAASASASAWWWRRNSKEYLPALGLQNQKEMKQFLLNHGVTVRKYRTPRQQYDACLAMSKKAGDDGISGLGWGRDALCSAVLVRGRVEASIGGSLHFHHIIFTALLAIFVLRLLPLVIGKRREYVQGLA